MSDLADIARPGTMLVFYMAMQQLACLSSQLMAASVRPDQPVSIASHVSRHNAQALHTTVQDMATDCAAANLKNPAVIMISLPKSGILGRRDPALAAVSRRGRGQGA
jgi:siroheme synthase